MRCKKVWGGRLTICIRRGKRVCQLPWTLKHLSNIVGSIDNVNLGGGCLSGLLVHAKSYKLTKVDALKAVAGSAHILVHNVSTSN